MPDLDLFGEPIVETGPKHVEPTKDEVAAAIKETRNEDGIDLPASYVRDMLAGRDPTDPAQRTEPKTCGNCCACQASRFGGNYCDLKLDTVRETDNACGPWWYPWAKETI